MATLQQYNTWRSSLVSLLEEAANACAAISPERAKLYTFLRNQLRDDTLKIQIVGTVKTVNPVLPTLLLVKRCSLWMTYPARRWSAK